MRGGGGGGGEVSQQCEDFTVAVTDHQNGHSIFFSQDLTLNDLCHTTPHSLCRFQAKDMHGLQCFA